MESRKRIYKRVKVDDDWYPTRSDQTIQITLMMLPVYSYSKYFVRLLAAGEDDYMLELYSEHETVEEADKRFNQLKDNIYDKIPDMTNQKYYKNLGFVMF